jgi:hypothetical protein
MWTFLELSHQHQLGLGYSGRTRAVHATVVIAEPAAAAAGGHTEVSFEIVGMARSIGCAGKLEKGVALRLFHEVRLRRRLWTVERQRLVAMVVEVFVRP